MAEQIKVQGLSMLVHGPSKQGKSTLCDTAPAPRLHLDAEGGSGTRFTKSNKKIWNPMKEPPPVADGTWETCVVHVMNYEIIAKVYEWLNSGKHSFRSVAIDSISEVQQRAIDSMVGTDPMQVQNWGELLRSVDKVIRDFRDLLEHPVKPLTSVIYVSMTRQRDGKWRPHVQGQLVDWMPYRVDICAYMFVVRDEKTGKKVFRLLLDQHKEYEAGSRVDFGRPTIDNPNVAKMIDVAFRGAS